MTATLTPPPRSASSDASEPGEARLSRYAYGGVRRTLVALSACMLGSLPLTRLVDGYAWLTDIWLAMAVALLPALVLRLRRPPGALQVWPGLALLLCWLTARYVDAHAALGFLPTSATWHDLSLLLDDLHATMNNDAAPVQATISVRLALSLLMALVAVLVDLLAVVGRHGALAGLPLLVIVTVCAAVTRAPVPWPMFVLAACGFLLLLSIDAPDDLTMWGHRVRGTSSSTGTALAASAPWIAVGAVVIALFAAALVPNGSHNLISDAIHNSGSGEGDGQGTGTHIDPFATLRGDLRKTQKIELADVTVDQNGNDFKPFYLRSTVLSTVRQSGWVKGDDGPQEPLDATQFPTIPPTNATGSDTSGSFTFSSDGSQTFSSTLSFDTGALFSATVRIANMSGNPVVFAVPTDVSGLSKRSRWDALNQTIVGSSVHSGDAYEMRVDQALPTVDELRAAPVSDPAVTGEWLQLPAYKPAVTQFLTQTLTKIESALPSSTRTQYDTARAINDYFTNPANGFIYDLQTQKGDSGSDIVDFLTNKRGFCQQYAASMGVLLREAGVPARVVLGYAHDVPDAAGRFSVTSDDAHAWVEAYFSGIGWVPFDPTPLAGISGGAANDLSYAPHPTRSTTARPSNSNNGSQAPLEQSNKPTNNGDNSSSASSTASTSVPVGWIVFGAIAVLLFAVLMAPGFIRMRRTRLRLRDARRSGPEPLWDELADTATDLGFMWSAARTPQQVSAWLAEPTGDAAPALTALAQRVEYSRYAPVEDTTAQAPIAELQSIKSALYADKTRLERLKLKFLPASVLSRQRH